MGSCNQRNYFLGFARINLSSLHFDHELCRSTHRELDQKKVKRLVDVFRLEGCQRDYEENCIAVLIKIDGLGGPDLARLKRASEFDKAQNLDQPHVSCLHGLHRISAARIVLNQNDRWWPCRVFSDDLSASASIRLIDSFRHEQPFSNGEIFLKILNYRKMKEVALEKQWWARLTPGKRKDLKQLLSNQLFLNAFMSLTKFPGLFTPLKLGTHRASALKCDEEILHCLHRIETVWTAISSGVHSEASEPIVDAETVRQLELLAPATFRGDRHEVEKHFSEGRCFNRVKSLIVRDKILRNVLEQRHLIPSLRTFFENLKLLEPCCQILKALLQDNQKRSIRQGFFACFHRPDHLVVELNEKIHQNVDSIDHDTDRLLGYIQLWQFCLRNFPDLVGLNPRKEIGEATPALKHDNPAFWQRIASLAVSLGFKADPILERSHIDIAKVLAERFIRQALQVEEEQEIPHENVTSVVRALETIDSSRKVEDPKPLLGSNVLGIERRCGRPFSNDHYFAKTATFLPSWKFSHQISGDHPSPSFVRYCFLYDFFDLDRVLPMVSITSPDGVASGPQKPLRLPSTDCAPVSSVQIQIHELQTKLSDHEITILELQKERDEIAAENATLCSDIQRMQVDAAVEVRDLSSRNELLQQQLSEERELRLQFQESVECDRSGEMRSEEHGLFEDEDCSEGIEASVCELCPNFETQLEVEKKQHEATKSDLVNTKSQVLQLEKSLSDMESLRFDKHIVKSAQHHQQWLATKTASKRLQGHAREETMANKIRELDSLNARDFERILELQQGAAAWRDLATHIELDFENLLQHQLQILCQQSCRPTPESIIRNLDVALESSFKKVVLLVGDSTCEFAARTITFSLTLGNTARLEIYLQQIRRYSDSLQLYSYLPQTSNFSLVQWKDAQPGNDESGAVLSKLLSRTAILVVTEPETIRVIQQIAFRLRKKRRAQEPDGNERKAKIRTSNIPDRIAKKSRTVDHAYMISQADKAHWQDTMKSAVDEMALKKKLGPPDKDPVEYQSNFRNALIDVPPAEWLTSRVTENLVEDDEIL